jgi:hypothetical protein
MMPVNCSLRDEISANTPLFSYPNGAMIFSAAIPICFQIDNQKKEALYRKL